MINLKGKSRGAIEGAIYLTVDGLFMGRSYKYRNIELIGMGKINNKTHWIIQDTITGQHTTFFDPQQAAKIFLRLIWVSQ